MATQQQHVDDLTGLLNKAGLITTFAKLDAAEPVALAVLDTDDFKSVNDTFGHNTGDELLRAHAQTIAGSLPPEAIVSRFGGDEFVVALPRTSAEGALILFEEVRAYLAGHVSVASIGRPVPITVGIAARPPHGSTFEDLLRAADGAMYRAKHEGRNRVAIHIDEKMVMKSNYYERGSLARLAKLSENLGRTEASFLREALDDVLEKYAGEL